MSLENMDAMLWNSLISVGMGPSQVSVVGGLHIPHEPLNRVNAAPTGPAQSLVISSVNPRKQLTTTVRIKKER